ncbi:MAG: CapA family protein [Oscillatoriales cyanobacterium]|uniref:CapA family protein n=1 Tax=unclassified Microcoleus TaxID=2642155 RepID=UPI001DD44E0B|nr:MULTISPECIES: CapA family protein [unclassified Microcoleus]TAE14079.1 MAG: CapA family protein [Oscillatoriales cyanobacterium]MCC3568303.1 CapA family protein [Microcoleus sp. PH2017_31_RDM_U_A]MCC3580558.1 CapA family protein [Microcoleus sp. PH2017_32_RDM_D_A]MCC3618687.1 CapA family protein [Microcoleus sp. PH2017_38_RDM_U_B]TAE25691.1 MAG: CapA family protein [Oscillatoriales cyanobacterium]
MSQQDILNLAKEGDARAIAFLIGQALQTFGVTAKGSLENKTLHLLLEAEQLPAEEACLRVAIKGLQRLQPNNIYGLTVYGRREGEQLPAWTQTVELKQRLASAPATAAASVSVATPVTVTAPVSVAPVKIPVAVASVPTAPIPVILPKIETPQNITTPPIQIPEKSPRKSYRIPTPKTTNQRQQKPSQPPDTIPTPKATNQRQQQPSPLPDLARRKTKKSWLSVGTLSLIFVPIAGFVLGSQFNKSSSTATINHVTSKPAVQKVGAAKPSRKESIPASASAAKPASQSPSQAAKIPANLPATVSIKAVGDMIPGTNFPYNKLPENKERLFESVKSYLQGADILFGNFESTMTDYPYSSKGGGGGMLFAFRTPPSYAKIFKDVGFDILNIANNHSYDFNEQGFKDTIKNIDSNGMKAVGKRDQIVYQNVKGVNVAFIGFSNYGEVHNSLLELKAGAEVVKKARQKADIVVISVHAGAEGTGAQNVNNRNEFFYGENRGNMVLFSRTMIDAGADLILGHGPHVTRALELYKGKLIAYSLGNFMGYRTLSTAGALGQSLILDVKMTPKGDFVSGKIIPIELSSQGIPSVDEDFRTVGLIRRLTKSDFPNTGLMIDDKGQILKKSK